MKHAMPHALVSSATPLLRRSAWVGLALAFAAHAQIAQGATKYLGNITTKSVPRAGFIQNWNQITPENETKWGWVEETRGVYNWKGADRVRDTAAKYGIPWKFHTLVWGSQYPKWMDGLDSAAQYKAIVAWFDAAAARYPNVQQIDVVNEAYMADPYDATKPKHAPAPFRRALGGPGKTGHDWIINAFKMARERWPKATLIYNEYNTLEWRSEINWIKATIPKLIAAGAPIDAVGFQAHGLKGMRADTLKNRLDEIGAAIKVPMYISEYDIADTSKAGEVQLANYKAHFPVMWNHPRVAGVTLWGYVYGTTWVKGTGIVDTNGVERPAMKWLREYVAANKSPVGPFNQSPTISMKLVSAQAKAPGAATLSWTAKDPDGTLKVVELLQGPSGIVYLPQAAGKTSATGTFSISDLKAGTYNLTPKVTDNLGKEFYGTSVVLTIAENKAPVISMKCASTGLVAPATLNCTWKASDSDGTVKLVELLQGPVGVNYLVQDAAVATATGKFSVAKLPMGTYSFTPKVTDNDGKVSYGSSLNVAVQWNYALTTSGAPNWYGGLYVGYSLPPTTRSATARLYNSNNELVKIINLRTNGTSSRFTALSGRPTGTYTVRLLVDGIVRASKTVVKF